MGHLEAAEKLLERMRASKAGWGENDLETLYLAFGFQFREGNHHRVYFHPKYPYLYATVARHRSLAKGYVSTAVKLIDQLRQLEKNND
jgi:hypothetical protein